MPDAPTDSPSASPPATPPLDNARPLLRDASFWGLTATQFLGAFNDNLYKQLLLLLFVAVPHGEQTQDWQSLALVMFSLPFILFSGFAGFLSDRYSKTRVIVFAKVAEIAIMAAGAAGFWAMGQYGLTGPIIGVLSAVLFCMGAQSAFFGPGKYGILPELFRDRDLPAANGIVLMTTFIAIILEARSPDCCSFIGAIVCG